MSCVSMGLAGWAIPINGSTATPETLNAWLRANSGYLCAGGDCNNLVLTAPSGLSTHELNVTFIGENQKPPLDVLHGWLRTGGYVPILHVRNRHHFVLCTGYDSSHPSTLYVNDPGYDQESYDYAEVSDILLYTIVPTRGARHQAYVPRSFRQHSKEYAVGQLDFDSPDVSRRGSA